MKITNQEASGRTTYYSVDAELDDGTNVSATLTVMDDDNSGVPDYDLVIVESDRELTDGEIEELKELACNNF